MLTGPFPQRVPLAKETMFGMNTVTVSPAAIVVPAQVANAVYTVVAVIGLVGL